MPGGWYDSQNLLVPRPGAVEWEAWDHSTEGATGYRSFADMLRLEAVRDRRFTPDATQLDHYVASARAGDTHALWTVAEFDGEQALTMTADLLDTDESYGVLIGGVRLLVQLAKTDGPHGLRDCAQESGRRPMTRQLILTAAAAYGPAPERVAARAALRDHLVQFSATPARIENLLAQFPR